MFNLFFVAILSYFVGSIPSGLIIGRFIKGIDIRDHGSGNMGATNVFRVVGKKYGLLVVILDALKGAIAVVLISRLYFGSFPFTNITPFDDFTLVQIICGLTAVVGHIWTVFAGFRGGKGIATALGFLITLITIDMLVALAVFILVVSISRYISLGSILAAISVPLILIVRTNIFNVEIEGYHTILPFCVAIAFLVIYTHRANISRLYRGVENRFSFAKKSSK
ncbi:MAG: glycerol-3-phosphate 1-O-acyltransferase PlsY [Bacteroidetes bacterium]|nr:glycerol-3-phosphate 1-O-acyltransferase PlsY [Bacteroidota bacterium]